MCNIPSLPLSLSLSLSLSLQFKFVKHGSKFKYFYIYSKNSTANNFLHLLAQETGGRYHRCQTDFDAQLFAHKLLTEGFEDTEYPHLPEFEGDDLRRLGSEINTARKYLSQSKQYRYMPLPYYMFAGMLTSFTI